MNNRHARCWGLMLVGGLSLGLSAALASEPTRQEVVYTYHPAGTLAAGQIATVDGPRTDVSDITRFEYNPQGLLSQVINPLGQTTHFEDYNAQGLAQRIVDANGVEWELRYSLQGWLLLSSIRHPSGDSALNTVTRYEYDAIGQVTRITQVDDSYLTFEYNAARQLTAMTNNLGERIEYTLDAEGNQTGETIKSVDGAITYTRSQTFDELSRLLSTVRADNSTEMAYRYDKSDNPVLLTDGNGNQTRLAYDGLERLKQQIDPKGHTVKSTYDAQNQLTSLTDQREFKTTYRYNGFGHLTTQRSVDTGTSTFLNDAAGNLIQQTDANGVISQYQYDALNRLTQITYPSQPALNITYDYDDTQNGNFGAGRLTRVEDGAGRQSFQYNHLGQVIEASHTVDGQTYSFDYHYNIAGQLARMTYPDGRVVFYGYDAVGQVNNVNSRGKNPPSRTTLASDFSYLPFGPLQSVSYGNGTRQSYDFDRSYRLTRQTLDWGANALMDLGYTYDGNDNITHVVDHLAEAQTQSLGYDPLNQLVTASGGHYEGRSFQYDPVGNRFERSTDSEHQFLEYAVNRNRLMKEVTTKNGNTSRVSYRYDDNGNTTQKYDGSRYVRFEYGAHNRLIRVTGQNVGESIYTAAEYAYNAFGERVKKTVNGQTTLYLYGHSGELLSEIDHSTGQVIRQYIYLNGVPLAYVESTTGHDEIYWVHNNHLGAPQLLTNDQGQIVWSNTPTPFGLPLINEDVDGDGTNVTFNLRFPGQYFDAETNLHYNYFRDYDPETGRYLQSDPIGLAGGMNTYGYVGGNPVGYVDPQGLAAQAICFINLPVCTSLTQALVNGVAIGVGAWGISEDWDRYNNYNEGACPVTKEDEPNHPDFKRHKKKRGLQSIPWMKGKGRKGFPDKKGDYWEPVPDGHKGTHDPHWDVQHPNGNHTPVYPKPDV